MHPSSAIEALPARTAVSDLSDPREAAAALSRDLAGVDPSLVLFFCSTEYDLSCLSEALQQHFPTVPVVGCTTAGEITPLGYSRSSITAVAFDAGYFAIEVALFHNLAEFSFYDAQQLVHSMLDRCKARAVAPIKGHSFALALLDGLSVREEHLLSVLSANLGSIPLLGGSAGDDLHLRDTHVYFDGEFHSDAAVLILVNTSCDFEVFSIDHLEDSDDKLVVTEAVEDERRVLELNARPAALEYASALGIEPSELNSLVFALNPLSVRIGDRYYPRAIQKVNDDLSLSFYCAVETGIVLTRSRPANLVGGLERLFAQLRQRIGEPQLMIGYDCIFRRLEIEHSGIQEEVSALMRRNRVIGFNTYGEQFDGMHLNQTFTGVALGSACLE